MYSNLFYELELIVGKEKMQNMCEQYLAKIRLDSSGNRFWKDCSGESMAIYPTIWKTPTKSTNLTNSITIPGAPTKQPAHLSPPRIVRYSLNDLTNE